MKMVSVRSSNIAQIGFEENTTLSLSSKSINILRIVFMSESIFDYYGVEKIVFEAFLKAPSVGKFFHANIKNKYEYEKVS